VNTIQQNLSRLKQTKRVPSTPSHKAKTGEVKRQRKKVRTRLFADDDQPSDDFGLHKLFTITVDSDSICKDSASGIADVSIPSSSTTEIAEENRENLAMSHHTYSKLKAPEKDSTVEMVSDEMCEENKENVAVSHQKFGAPEKDRPTEKLVVEPKSVADKSERHILSQKGLRTQLTCNVLEPHQKRALLTSSQSGIVTDVVKTVCAIPSLYSAIKLSMLYELDEQCNTLTKKKTPSVLSTRRSISSIQQGAIVTDCINEMEER